MALQNVRGPRICDLSLLSLISYAAYLISSRLTVPSSFPGEIHLRKGLLQADTLRLKVGLQNGSQCVRQVGHCG